MIKGGAKIIPGNEIDKTSFADGREAGLGQVRPRPKLKELIQEIINTK